MGKLLIILSLLAVTSLAVPINLQELQTLWSAWKVYYNKFYTEGEEAARFAIFVDNYEKIVDLNSKNSGVKFAMNNFGDITSEEFKYIYASGHGVESSGFQPDFNTQTANFDIELPTSVDWRTKNAIAPVESQGQCGACWVFAAVGSLESFHYINNGSMVVFSNQQIIDCAPKSAGCDEGLMSKAYVYTAAKGMEPQADYPYTAQVGTCEYNASLAIKVNTGFQWLPFKDLNAFKTALVKQPVATVIEADQEIFQFYSSGVISQDCGSDVDHSVLVVGYETYSGQDAFIVQNSWGDEWGLSGYVYISTNATANHGNGVCGILSSPIIPV